MGPAEVWLIRPPAAPTPGMGVRLPGKGVTGSQRATVWGFQYVVCCGLCSSTWVSRGKVISLMLMMFFVL